MSACRVWWLCFAQVLLLTACTGTPPSEDSQPIPPEDPVEEMTNGGSILMPDSSRQRLILQDARWEEALRIHYNAIVFDGHIDTPTLMHEDGYRFGERHRPQAARNHVDLPRMFEGGLDAAFFALYIPAALGEGPAATARARSMIQTLSRQVEALDEIELAMTAHDVRRITRAGRKAALISIEGGHALAGSKEVLGEMRALGVRSIGLTHVNSHSWADASQSRPRWNGLNEAGERMIEEMNRAGVVIDVSHVSDSTFYDVMRVSRAPVIASHSSARALVDNVRNLSDDMLRALARNGGVAMVMFFDPAVNSNLTREVMGEVYRRIERHHGGNLRVLWQVISEVQRERGLSGATLNDVLDHIEHMVHVAGMDHVGLGSDFDGVFSLARGLEDVTRLPWITHGLLVRGFSETDIYKILGGNMLRVLEEVDEAAATPEQGRELSMFLPPAP